MRRQDKAARMLLPLGLIALVAVGWSVVTQRRTVEIREHSDKAIQAAGQGDVSTAEAEWQAALRLDPKNPRIPETMAQYEMESGRWAQAVDAFRSLEKVAPTTQHLYCRLAACLLRADDQKGAFDTASTELRHDPNCVAALGLVTSLMVLQPNSDAKQRREYMHRLVQLQPSDLDFLHMYAEELADSYLYDDLRPIVAQILKVEPKDAEAYNLLGYADLASPDQPAGVNHAVQDFKSSLAINPANGGAHFGLGRAALRQGRARDAIAELEIARKMRPDAVRIEFELGNAYRMAGETKLAEESKKRVVAWQKVAEEHRQLQVRCIAYPKDPQYPRKMALLLAEHNGDPGETIYYLQKALRLAPDDKELGDLLEKIQQQHTPGPVAPEKVAAANGATPFR